MNTVYRIQDAEGRGPWRPGFSKFWVEDRDDHDLLLPWYQQFGRVDQRVLSGMHMGCGCKTVEQLQRWFIPTEYRRLVAYGFHAVQMDVGRILASRTSSACSSVCYRCALMCARSICTSWRKWTHEAQPFQEQGPAPARSHADNLLAQAARCCGRHGRHAGQDGGAGAEARDRARQRVPAARVDAQMRVVRRRRPNPGRAQEPRQGHGREDFRYGGVSSLWSGSRRAGVSLPAGPGRRAEEGPAARTRRTVGQPDAHDAAQVGNVRQRREARGRAGNRNLGAA